MITDLTLPIHTGSDLAQRIHAVAPKLLIVLTSGNAAHIAPGKAIASDRRGNVLVAGDAWDGETRFGPRTQFFLSFPR